MVQHGQMVKKSDFEALIEPLGRELVQRSTLYGDVEPNKKLKIKKGLAYSFLALLYMLSY